MVTKLGVWPQDRYYLSWITQRMANRAPEVSHARQSPTSVFKQLANPIGQSIEEATIKLIKNRDNGFVSTCDVSLIDHLYRLDLNPSISYSYTQDADNNIVYSIPRVYGTIRNVEYELTQVYENSIENLYKSIPSRIEDGETSYLYEPVIDSTLISNLINISPNNPIIPGHLYITITGNETWEARINDKIYYAKVFITGTTRKGTDQTEAIPIRWNGTFKTINQWERVEEIFVSYLDQDAYISIDCLPWFSDGILDTQNLNIDPNGEEKFRFLNIKQQSFGSTFISESYVTNDFDGIRAGMDAKDIEHEIELLNSTNQNINIDAFTIKPNTNYLFCADSNYIYIYNTKLEFPNVSFLKGEDPDVKMDLYTNEWIVPKETYATINTRLLDFNTIPVKTRWTLETESGDKYTLNENGSIVSYVEDSWSHNYEYESLGWLEKSIKFKIENRGSTVITLDCFYYDETLNTSKILSTKFLFFAPYIIPENIIAIPDTISTIDDMSFDSDGNLWIQSNNYIKLLNVYYDYFLADYSRNILWLREDYSSVRIDV